MVENTEKTLTQHQKEFLIGCLLGDGYLSKPTSEKSNSHFACQHGQEQSDYNKYKMTVLESLNAKYYEYTRKTPSYRTGKYYSYNIVSTVKNKELTELRKKLYVNGKKTITKEILENFTAYSLAILFMDDGNRTKPVTSGEQTSYHIATCGFDKQSLEIFVEFLWHKFHLEVLISKDNRLYIRMNSRNLFESLVMPYIQEIECMHYKFRKECVS